MLLLNVLLQLNVEVRIVITMITRENCCFIWWEPRVFYSFYLNTYKYMIGLNVIVQFIFKIGFELAGVTFEALVLTDYVFF